MSKPPDEAALREAALAHLSRFAATEAGLLRVLNRRVQRWAARERAAAVDPETIADQVRAARDVAASVARRLAAAGAVDDAAFAATRAARLARSGRSRRVIAAHLAARGIDRETAGAALSDDRLDEFAAAILFARRRRIGPFGPDDPATAEAADRGRRELAAFARAGFPRDVALRVIGTSRDRAEAAIADLRGT